jgi:hypothetical protein
MSKNHLSTPWLAIALALGTIAVPTNQRSRTPQPLSFDLRPRTQTRFSSKLFTAEAVCPVGACTLAVHQTHGTVHGVMWL